MQPGIMKTDPMNNPPVAYSIEPFDTPSPTPSLEPWQDPLADLPSEAPVVREHTDRPVAPAPKHRRADPRFGTCAEAIAAGYGPYTIGIDPEYDWYIDRDSDGIVCER
jgi:hypothetical protein